MGTDGLNFTQRNAQVLARRAKRARRSQWLGRMLFSLICLGLLFVLRMNPALVTDVLAHVGKSPPIIAKPSDVRVRVMPTDAVPVRRGGATDAAAMDDVGSNAQAHAETVSARLTRMTPGG